MGTYDLAPLSWVLPDLRKSLPVATSAAREFLHALESQNSDMDSAVRKLHEARRLFHQAASALAMIGQSEASSFLSACANLVRSFGETPAQCTPEAVSALEKAHLAISDYLEQLLKKRPAPALCLFAQYKDVLACAGVERIHPADLWHTGWRWIAPASHAGHAAIAPHARLKAQLDHALLRLLHSADSAAAGELSKKCAVLSAGAQSLELQCYWFVAAAFFEACEHKLIAVDVYLKRTASQLLQQVAQAPPGALDLMERIAQDAAFFCLRVTPQSRHVTRYLQAFHASYGWMSPPQGDYGHVYFGRFDPVQLDFLRQRLAVLADSWSGFVGGDSSRAPSVLEHVAAAAQALLKLHPQGAPLVHVLSKVIGACAASGAKQNSLLAMEVATTLLYLEAVYDDLSAADGEVVERMAVLARRLNQVADGHTAEPVEPWMEALYRRLSERQSMGSVTSELRTALAAVELALEKYLRDPQDTGILGLVSGHLSQMHGVFSVLGLQQASSAVLSIRELVDSHLSADKRRRPIPLPIYERIARCVSTIGFMVDMLSYQVSFAKEMFVFDAQTGEFNYLNGRLGGVKRIDIPQVAKKVSKAPAARPTEGSKAVPVSPHSGPSSQDRAPANKPPSIPADSADFDGDDDGAEILDIFLEEAGGVLEDARIAMQLVRADAQQLDAFVVVRRAFHTLKGGARMVGLDEFGESAWAFEQLMNLQLAAAQPPGEDLMGLLDQSLCAFSDWVRCIRQAKPTHWSAQIFRQSADAMRVDGRWVQLQVAVPQVAILANTQLPVLHPEEPDDTGGSTHLENSNHAVADLIDTLEFDDAAPSPVNPQAIANQMKAAVASSSEVDSGGSGWLPLEAKAQAVTVDMPHQDRPPDLLDAFFAVFLTETTRWALSLFQALQGWDTHVSFEQRRVVQDLAHSIRGNAAAVGIKPLAQLSQALEQVLELMHPFAVIEAAHIQLLLELAQTLLEMLQDCRSGKPVLTADRLLTALAEVELAYAAPPGNPVTSDEDIDEYLTRPREAAIGRETVFDSDLDALGRSDVPAAIEGIAADTQDNGTPAVAVVKLAIDAPIPVRPIYLDEADQFDSQDQLDIDLLPVFREEGAEILLTLGKSLRQWIDQPQDTAPRAQILRLLHTLKGSGRLAGAFRLGELAHRMESSIEASSQHALQADAIEPLLLQLDAMQRLFDSLGPLLPDQAILGQAQQSVLSTPLPMPESAPQLRVIEGAAALPSSRASLIRVKAEVVERLVDQAGEVSVYRSRTEAHLGQMGNALLELGQTLDRFSSQLRELELQADMRIQSRHALVTDASEQFDPLEFDRFTRLQEISRMLAEAVGDVATVRRTVQSSLSASQQDLEQQARQMRELQRDLLRMRLVHFDVVADRLYGVVRQTAKELDKQVSLDLEGGDIELDRSVLERMTPAFEHLLRNAVVHGIESPQERVALGKTPTGHIKVQLVQDGNDIAIQISDDGRGLSLTKVREKAEALGLLTPQQAIDTASLMNVIFAPGFSTASAVTELAGRGIGLDVVLSEVNALGGRIDNTSQEGEGTQFKLVLPLTTAVTQVLIVRLGVNRIGVPAGLVETVLRTPADQLRAAYRQGQLSSDRGTNTVFFSTGALLQMSQDALDPKAHTYPTLVLRSAGQRMAFHVDEVVGNREVVVKNMGPQLSRLPGLAGITMLPSGEALLIYNLIALAVVYGAQTAKPAVDGGQGPIGKSAQAAELAPLILVVDDAITVRRVIQRMLLREGYRVALANDGVQALQILENQKTAHGLV